MIIRNAPFRLQNWLFVWSIEELKMVIQAFQICESYILYGQ